MALEQRAALALERGELVGTGADRLGRDLGAALLDRLLGHDAAGDVADRDVEQVRARLREHDAARVRAGDLDALEIDPVALVGAFLGARRRHGDALEGELHVLGGHLAEPVGEHLAGLEAELDDRGRGLLHLRCGVELEFGRVRLLLHQTLVHGANDVAVPGTGSLGGIEVGEVAVDAHRDGGARTRALRLRVGSRGDAAHEACGGGSGEDLPAVHFDGHLSSPWPNAPLYREAVPLFVSVTNAADFASRISAFRHLTRGAPPVERTPHRTSTRRSSGAITDRGYYASPARGSPG